MGVHKNVIEYLGVYSVGNQMYMIFEHADRGDLKKHLDTHRKSNNLNSETEVDSFFQIRAAFEIANGMEYISSLNIVHKDLAARNILLDKSYNCKISDFGLCKSEYASKRPIR